ncbi:hypothetical protein MKX01_039690 [Papaver californicum]|nr:hypothetical protein MKX01_039690 [Papaver californicum]
MLVTSWYWKLVFQIRSFSLQELGFWYFSSFIVLVLKLSCTGWRTYRRPDAKSGGHGVGWSPIIPYTFSVPQGWEEVPVSIADLGGTEIDLRFASSQAGRLFVIVAPVLRFSSCNDWENVEGKVLNTEVAEHSRRKYYHYELETPHVLMSTTAAGNQLYIFAVTANDVRKWRRLFIPLLINTSLHQLLGYL